MPRNEKKKSGRRLKKDVPRYFSSIINVTSAVMVVVLLFKHQ